MKKLLTLLLTLLMVFTLVGCNSTKEEEPVVVDTPQINEPETKIEEPVVVENTETKEETVDPTQYSYWVVFRNPDGNELQRTIEKYGTTPVYTGDTPVYWDSENWYRFTNWDQELKPITTNTYITAEYEFGGELKKEEVIASTPIGDCKVTLSGGTGSGHGNDEVILYVFSGTTVTSIKDREADRDQGEMKTLKFMYNGSTVGSYTYADSDNWTKIAFTLNGVEMADGATETINSDITIYITSTQDQPPA